MIKNIVAKFKIILQHIELVRVESTLQFQSQKRPLKFDNLVKALAFSKFFFVIYLLLNKGQWLPLNGDDG